MTKSMIRVLLIDDHPIVLLGLRVILSGSPGIEVVGAERGSESGLAAFLTLEPDVVLMDLSMPGEGGLEAMRRIHEADADARVLVLTSTADFETLTSALLAGASGYVLKGSDSAELVAAVRASAGGEIAVDSRLVPSLRVEPVRSDEFPLTPRESEVLRLVRSGLTNKQIASRLGISGATVKHHLSNVFQRIGVTDRTSAALWADRHMDRHAVH